MTTLHQRRRLVNSRALIGAGAVALCLGLAGCGSNDSPAATDSPTQTPAPTTDGTDGTSTQTSPGQTATGAQRVDVDQRFAEWADGVRAVTYDPQAIPVGSEVSVDIEPRGSGVKVDLDVDGVQANRDFGAHVHVNPCGADGDDAGPHYQDQKDPNTPSTDPEFANDRNEVWLDFTTDADGDGEAETTVQWQFRPGEGRSVVIHEQHTATHAGEAGTAGDRLACVTLY